MKAQVTQSAAARAKPEIKWPAIFRHKHSRHYGIKEHPGQSAYLLITPTASVQIHKEDSEDFFEDSSLWEYVTEPLTIRFTP
jgi:hypothetical protein